MQAECMSILTLDVIHQTNVANAGTKIGLQGVPKNDPTCFCQNFIKSSPNLTIFGIQIAKMIEKCKVHSLSTSHSLYQRTTM